MIRTVKRIDMREGTHSREEGTKGVGEGGGGRGGEEEGHKYVNLFYAMSHTIHIVDMIGQY